MTTNIPNLSCKPRKRTAAEGVSAVTEDAGTVKGASWVLSERKLSRRLGYGTDFL